MMSTIENPKLTLPDLARIEAEIRSNKASADTYRQLDNYLNFVGFAQDYFLNQLRSKGISGYEEFIDQRTRPGDNQLPYLVGMAMGIIATIRKYISGK